MEGPREHTARGQGPTGGGWAARGSGPRGQLFPQSCDVRSRPALVRGCGSLSHRGRMDVPSPVRSHPCLGRGSPERPPGAGRATRDCAGPSVRGARRPSPCVPDAVHLQPSPCGGPGPWQRCGGRGWACGRAGPLAGARRALLPDTRIAHLVPKRNVNGKENAVNGRTTRREGAAVP